MTILIPESLFKDDLTRERFEECHPILREIAVEMMQWCQSSGVCFLITASKSTEGEDRILQRVSATHREGRAFDMSCHNWPPDKIERFIEIFSAHYREQAAQGLEGFPRLIVHHNSGHGDHFHIQIKRGLNV